MNIKNVIKNYLKRRRILKTIRVLDNWRSTDGTYPMINVYGR